jgi:hypothetical protein
MKEKVDNATIFSPYLNVENGSRGRFSKFLQFENLQTKLFLATTDDARLFFKLQFMPCVKINQNIDRKRTSYVLYILFE